MMVFFKERLAYLAIPKTGTTAVERALQRRASAVLREPPGIKHTNARAYERRFRAMFERGDLPSIETVAVMREPISWLGSWYRYRQRPTLDGHKNSTKHVSFDEFIAAYLSEEQPPFAELGSQARFVTDSEDDLLINHLFRYEDIDTFRAFMEERLGVEIDFPSANTSPRTELSLSPELEKALRKRHALDFQIYGALMDGPLSISWN